MFGNHRTRKKNPRTTYFYPFISLKTNCSWKGGRNRLRFCYVGLRNISSFAVLSKANVFFVDPKKVKLIGVRQKEKKKVMRLEIQSS